MRFLYGEPEGILRPNPVWKGAILKYAIIAVAALAMLSGRTPASAQNYNNHGWEHGHNEYRYHQAPHGRYFAAPPRHHGGHA